MVFQILEVKPEICSEMGLRAKDPCQRDKEDQVTGWAEGCLGCFGD